jgi:hypothetical protein
MKSKNIFNHLFMCFIINGWVNHLTNTLAYKLLLKQTAIISIRADSKTERKKHFSERTSYSPIKRRRSP